MTFSYSDYKRKLQYITEHANSLDESVGKKVNPEWEKQKAEIKDMHRASLKDLASKLDPHYQRSDDYGYFKHHDAIAQQMHWLKKQIGESAVDESGIDFGSIGKTLSKYGNGVPAGNPKKPSRSAINTDYTMTGHREKKSTTGRVYSKVLTDYDDDAYQAAKATQPNDQTDEPKRGRGRPAGASNKNGSGVTGTGWSAEAKASFKAKLAAKKAAKLAAKNESEELDESFVVTDGKGQVVHTAYSQSSARAKADQLTKQTGVLHSVKFIRDAVVESYDLDEEDWAEIAEEHSIDDIVEFMLDEDFEELDELSKSTLASYVNKADRDIDYRTNLAAKAHKTAQTFKFKTRADKAAMIDRAEGYAAKADKRNSGIKRAIEKQHESIDPTVEYYANRITESLNKE